MREKKPFIPRVAQRLLREGIQSFPVTLITGARQTGKSTLIREELSDMTYVTLDDLDARGLALTDPRLFFEKFSPPVIIDEIQYAPELLSYIKIIVDENRQTMGQFVLTGSQIFPLMKGVSESLAGRVMVFDLFALTWNELIAGGYLKDPTDYQTLLQTLRQGFYPELYALDKTHMTRWFRSYVRTYIERDVRHIKAVVDLASFQTFMKLLAARVGQLLNLSEIAKEVGISSSTAKEWLSILESTYIIYQLRPFFRNQSKRYVKSPKLYFCDTGLLCHLLGIESNDQLQNSPFLGSIFENMVVLEFVKHLDYSLSPQKCYFHRTQAGSEVDLILAGIKPEKAYEIKFAMRLNSHMASGLSRLKKEAPDVELALLSLAENYPGIPHHGEIKCLHWYEEIDRLFK
ncbi:MAG: ATP-binding protein [Chlamydiales bacterium]|nr:ATP-binding protein [Chlamydiales bacterium]